MSARRCVQRLLSTKSDEFQHSFLEHLKQSQDQAFREITVGRVPPPPGSLDAETLSLVDSVSVESNTVVERHASKVAGHADLALRDLNLVVAFVLGRSAVRNSENPLGPTVYVRALLRAAEDSELHKEAWDFLLARYEKPLGEELGQIVRQLLEHFSKHGVDVRAIRRNLAVPKTAAAGWQPPGVAGGATSGDWGAGGSGATRPGPGGAVAAAEGGPSRAPAAPDEPTQLLGGLLTRLQSNARGSRLPALPSLGPAPQELLQSIGEMQRDGVDDFAETGDFAMMAPAQPISAVRGELIAKSTRTVDKLTIELVGMLFDHVMQDKQVPAEIKARLSRLQFPVLKAALMDAAFFASSAHPARKLIDRIAGTSAGWEPYGDDNQKYLKEVERVISEILKKFETDLSVFEKVYAEFDRFVSDIDAEGQRPGGAREEGARSRREARDPDDQHDDPGASRLRTGRSGAVYQGVPARGVGQGPGRGHGAKRDAAGLCEGVPRCHSRTGVVGAAEGQHRGPQQAGQDDPGDGARAARWSRD